LVDELEKSRRVSRGLDEAGLVDGSVRHLLSGEGGAGLEGIRAEGAALYRIEE
jgi:hypothetical protein